MKTGSQVKVRRPLKSLGFLDGLNRLTLDVLGTEGPPACSIVMRHMKCVIAEAVLTSAS